MLQVFQTISEQLYLRKVIKKGDLDFLLTGYQFSRLFGKQIEEILEIIDKEVLISFRFGLKLSHEDVLKEKTLVLVFINSLGNIHLIPGRIKLDRAIYLFGELMNTSLSDQIDFYFDKYSSLEKRRKKMIVKNMYNCHLEMVKTSVLRAVYNKKLFFP